MLIFYFGFAQHPTVVGIRVVAQDLLKGADTLDEKWYRKYTSVCKLMEGETERVGGAGGGCLLLMFPQNTEVNALNKCLFFFHHSL